jgi:hypothetical protein
MTMRGLRSWRSLARTELPRRFAEKRPKSRSVQDLGAKNWLRGQDLNPAERDPALRGHGGCNAESNPSHNPVKALLFGFEQSATGLRVEVNLPAKKAIKPLGASGLICL